MTKNRKQRIIKFKSHLVPEIIPWLNAQKNQTTSVYLLIRMAQSIGGNSNWPDVVQSLANPRIIRRILNLSGDETQHKSGVNSLSQIGANMTGDNPNHHLQTPHVTQGHVASDKNDVNNKKVSKSDLSDIISDKNIKKWN